MSKLSLRCEPRHDLTPDEIDRLEDHLYRHTAERIGLRDARGIGFVAHLGEDLAGAVAGFTWGGICDLKQVWVREDLRGQGLGRSLVQAALAEAQLRGCVHAFLATQDFQAPGFYRKLGFELVAEVPDKPVGHTEFIFRRSLAA
jgi:ribosomal protein S18 acetylase RimI-like enzyme